MKFSLMCVVILMFFGSMAAEINNPDKPAKGNWDVKLEKVWAVENAGDDVLSSIRNISVADDGTVYVHDRKNLRFYIFSADGKFLKAFGKKGEGPGEVRNLLQANHYAVGNKVAVCEDGRVHYFDARGEYINTAVIRNDKYPFFFISQNEFVSAPLSAQAAGGKDGKITITNTGTGTEKVICRFTPKEEVVVREGEDSTSVQHPALTPFAIIGYKDGIFYYGMNDKYKINICDMDGNYKGAFTLDRERCKVSEKVKFDVLWTAAKGRAPRDMIEQLAKKMPSDENHFSKIQVIDGLIYVYNCYYDRKNLQGMDIFSLEGKYLYRAVLSVPEGHKIPLQPVYKDGYFYLNIEDEEGIQTVGKYKVTLPKG